MVAVRPARPAAGLVIVLVAIAAVAWYGLMPFGAGMCANTELARAANPSGDLDAVVFRRDCGATTDFSTQVALVGHGRALPDAAGDVFVAGNVVVQVAWDAPRVLRVRHAADATIYHKAERAHGVAIRYAALPASGA